MNFLRSILKSQKLAKISRTLGSAPSLSGGWAALQEAGRQRNLAMDALLDLVQSQPDLKRVMQHYSADRSVLQQVYANLCAAGAGQWARDHYVAASSLAFVTTLDFLLRQPANADWRGIAFRLLEYFDHGEIGEIRD